MTQPHDRGGAPDHGPAPGSDAPHPARDPQGAAEAFLATCDAFARALEAETRAVRALDLADLDSLVERKTAWARAYARQAQDLRSHGDSLKASGGEALKTRLMQAQEQIGTAISENLQVLDAACTSSRRVVEMIVDAARRAQAQTTGYAPGSDAAGDGLRSVNLNTSL